MDHGYLRLNESKLANTELAKELKILGISSEVG
jgi:hypothetical protein